MKFLLLILITLFGCNEPISNLNPNEKKIIDTGKFEIEVPANWNYQKAQGFDSFVGRIGNEEVDLSFDWSEMGYANSLSPRDIQNYQIHIDTVEQYTRKIIRPNSGQNGTTGVYFQDMESRFNFNLHSENLSLENQEKAIDAFETIKINRE